MTKEKIDALIAQTSFLLEKQKELFGHTSGSFDSLIKFIDEKLKTMEYSESEQYKDLKAISDFIVEHKEQAEDELQDDINFLAKQIEAISEINKIQDEAKAEELLNMIIDKDEKLAATDEFKKQLIDDIENSKKEFNLMIDDLKNSIEEGDFHSLRLLLEAAAQKESEKEDCCNSCSSCHGCPSDSNC